VFAELEKSAVALRLWSELLVGVEPEIP